MRRLIPAGIGGQMSQIHSISLQRGELIIKDKKANTQIEDTAPMLEELTGDETR